MTHFTLTRRENIDGRLCLSACVNIYDAGKSIIDRAIPLIPYVS